MTILNLGSDQNKKFVFLPTNFNKRKFSINYGVPQNPILLQMQNMGRRQCLTDKCWPENEQIHAWMITAETATFMKCGGLGMVASELPENYNQIFTKQKSDITIITPMYLGDTGKKKCTFENGVYIGAEGKQIKLQKLCRLKVPFMGSRNRFCHFKVDVYQGTLNGAAYLFLHNDRFFSINPAAENPSGQSGCYVLNNLHVDEVERFAFLSKTVYCLLENICLRQIENIRLPNILLANDWHSGAISGLTKYLSLAKVYAERLPLEIAEILKEIPVIHIAHHMGYQGWDYNNTSKILNSLYEDLATLVLKNAKAVKNSNPRTSNTLIVGDTYNQASCNMHLADRIVTVSKNYMEEVSREKSFGFDFRDILKIRKNCRTFFGIVNGYEKKLISPNAQKIETLNKYFGDTQFKVYSEYSLQNKLHNKKECIKLLSRLATDENYRQTVIPKIDTYNFDDISSALHDAENIPFICMTSRLVEQKGYDIALNAILRISDKYKNSPQDFPIFVLGGAGNRDLFRDLMALKDNTKQIYRDFAKRIFVFHGYNDYFAYSVQLAADFYLMPSYFEPCGLTQMEAMAKGCLPVATSTGGLVDTIQDGVDGFRTEVFFADGNRVYGPNLQAQHLKNNINAYFETLEKAIRCFYTAPKTMHQMQSAAMKNDFSWSIPEGSVYKYDKLFHSGSL